MNELQIIYSEISWCMLFAYDIILVGQSLMDINGRLKEGSKALEDKRSRINWDNKYEW